MSQMTPRPEAKVQDHQPKRECEEKGTVGEELGEVCEASFRSLAEELDQSGTGLGRVEGERRLCEFSV